MLLPSPLQIQSPYRSWEASELLGADSIINDEKSACLFIPPDPRGRPGGPPVSISANRLINPNLVLKGGQQVNDYKMNQTLMPVA